MNTNNFINLIGRVGQDPTRHNFDNGGSVLELSLATNDNYKDRAGNRVERTQWHRVKAFGPVVDVLERYVSKGDRLSVVGTLRYSAWTDNANQARKTAEIILDSFSFISGSRRKDGEASPPLHTPDPAPGSPTRMAGPGNPLGQPQLAGAMSDDDQIPF